MNQYMGSKAYWNEKFRARKNILMPPEELLKKDVKLFAFGKKGLELACGDGRNLLYLANEGYEMTGIDFSESALERIESFELKKTNKITTLCADLTNPAFLTKLKKYNFIFINHYRLDPKIYPMLTSHLLTDGFLWVNGFHRLPSDNMDITEQDIITKRDFSRLNLKEIDYLEYEINNREFMRILLKSSLGKAH